MKKEFIINFIWRFLERISAQGISFIVSIVLARLLLPEDYGTVALITVFLAILQVFVDSGLGNALIQKKDANEVDFSTVFYFNICMCFVIYILLFFMAPYIAVFYNNPKMTSMIRVVGIILIVSGLKNVQQAYVARNMLFKRFFWATLGGTICSAVLGIFLAYQGFGAWALIAQQLSNTLIDTLLLWVTVRWRPTEKFSWYSFKSLFSYGWKLLVSALLDTFYGNLRSLLIGKRFSKKDLGYYNNGQKIPALIIANLNVTIGSVLFPTLAKEQGQRDTMRAHVRRGIQISSYLIWPMMLGCVACAESLVELLLTEKWLPSVPYLQMACVSYALMPIHTTNLQAINAMGRSDIFLRLEIIKKTIGIIALIIAVPYGVMAIAFSAVITSIISSFINAWPNRTLLKYSYLDQLKDILPSLLLASFMCFAVLQVERLSLAPIWILCIQVPFGIVIYLVGSLIFKMESLSYIRLNVKNILRRR